MKILSSVCKLLVVVYLSLNFSAVESKDDVVGPFSVPSSIYKKSIYDRIHPEAGKYVTEISMYDGFVTQRGPGDSAYISDTTGLHGWTSSQTVITLFFYAAEKTSFDVYIRCQVLSGEKNTLRLKLQNMTRDVDVSGRTLTDFRVGRLAVNSAGYYSIDLSGLLKDSTYFADVTHLIFENDDTPAIRKINGVRSHPSPAFWYRYDSPEIEYFYLESIVPTGFAPNMSSYDVISSSCGTFRFHVLDDERSITMSIWPDSRLKDNKVKFLSKGKDVVEGTFGTNNAGGIAILNYDWKTDTTYRMLLRGRPMVQNATFTIYSVWWAEDKGDWNLLASFSRPNAKRELVWGVGSYLDDFFGVLGYLPRAAFVGNQWAISEKGVWQEVTEADFGMSGGPTGKVLDEPRVQFDAGTTVIGGTEFLKLRYGGFEKGLAAAGQTFSRKATGRKPNIVFSDLPGN